MFSFKVRTDLNLKDNNTLPGLYELEPPSVATSIPSIVEVQQTGPDSEEAIEMSSRGRRKRAPRHIGALNGCLCRMVINPNIDSSAAIECKQPGCETRWVYSIVLHY